MWMGYDGDGTERAVTGAEQHPHEVRQPFFGPDGRDHLGLGVELDAEAAQVERGDGLAQLGDALAGRVPVVLRVVDGLGQLLDGRVGRRQVGVAEPEVDDVATGSTGRQLQRLDVREDVRGQAVDPSELHRARLVPTCAPARRRAPALGSERAAQPSRTSAAASATASTDSGHAHTAHVAPAPATSSSHCAI